MMTWQNSEDSTQQSQPLDEAAAAELPPTAEAADGAEAAGNNNGDGLLTPDTIVDWFNDNWATIAWTTGVIAAAIVLGLILHAIVFAVLKRIVRKTPWAHDDAFIRRLRKPSMLLFPLLMLHIIMPLSAELETVDLGFLKHVVSLLTIGTITWLISAAVVALADSVKGRHDVTVADNLEARRIHTQVNVLSRTIIVFIVIVGIAVGLMTFDRIRELGTGLLASAGLAGLAIGLAARPVLENIIGGLQIALTQPIRIDDVVIVDGEWGRIEEITTTYVVVRIWDERRLIVPFSKFISDSFENWTRTSANTLGTVLIYTDYTVPVEAVRKELQRLIEGHEKWDGRVCGLQVVELSERTMHLRALISAANSGNAWDLRVYLREKLVEFLQHEYPEALPRTRVELPNAEKVLKSD